ncbi:hypothetical protein ZIOFF_028958 [Zingiber officinale]|uniref:SPX domain-containing protein n=1 Tax=Zingiber officinale TaxID=94328 RepID=A0A8J5LE54_ZINOF|nr:hypothetical protein ZIOFF_028958 [Zingiber officinale]
MPPSPAATAAASGRRYYLRRVLPPPAAITAVSRRFRRPRMPLPRPPADSDISSSSATVPPADSASGVQRRHLRQPLSQPPTTPGSTVTLRAVACRGLRHWVVVVDSDVERRKWKLPHNTIKPADNTSGSRSSIREEDKKIRDLEKGCSSIQDDTSGSHNFIREAVEPVRGVASASGVKELTATITSRALRERYQIWLEDPSGQKTYAAFSTANRNSPTVPSPRSTLTPPPLTAKTIPSTSLWFIILVVMNSGLVKILKKYDKRTGALIRQPFIEKVLQQAFFTTDLLYKLVKECVAMLDHLFPSNNLSISAECDGQNGVPKPVQSGGRVPELEEIKYMQSLYMKSTVAALRSLKQIRSKSSTVKTD